MRMGELELEMEMEAGERCWTKLAVVSELSLGGVSLARMVGKGQVLGDKGQDSRRWKVYANVERERYSRIMYVMYGII